MTEIPTTRASLLVRLRDPQDDSAWTEFVDLYVPVVYGYARRQGLQDADAIDLTQEVLGAVARGVGGLDYDPERGTFRGWLFTIVRRRLANWRRSHRVRPQASGNTAERQILEERPAPEGREAEWETEWRRRLFAWACERVRRDVSGATWQAFWRTAIDGQAGKQVAAELGLSVAAVYLARRRIVTRLRELVQSVQEP
jgi:RNA polymerase sigma-70 factor (ECF subfamily)